MVESQTVHVNNPPTEEEIKREHDNAVARGERLPTEPPHEEGKITLPEGEGKRIEAGEGASQ